VANNRGTIQEQPVAALTMECATDAMSSTPERSSLVDESHPEPQQLSFPGPQVQTEPMIGPARVVLQSIKSVFTSIR
jgi:hypothetical protein